MISDGTWYVVYTAQIIAVSHDKVLPDPRRRDSDQSDPAYLTKHQLYIFVLQMIYILSYFDCITKTTQNKQKQKQHVL